MIRVVLFDIDGTLIQSGGAGMKAFEKTAATAFHSPEGTRGLRFAGRTDTSIVRAFFERTGIEASEANFNLFFDTYAFWLDHFLPQLSGKRVPGVTEFLESLRYELQPPVVGLLTGNIRLGAEIKLRHFGLWEYFELGAFGSDHDDRDQLAVLAWERSCQRFNRSLDGEEILVIGDTPLDIQCARKIGARVLVIAGGSYSRAELEEAYPDWACEDFRGLKWVDIRKAYHG